MYDMFAPNTRVRSLEGLFVLCDRGGGGETAHVAQRPYTAIAEVTCRIWRRAFRGVSIFAVPTS